MVTIEKINPIKLGFLLARFKCSCNSIFHGRQSVRYHLKTNHKQEKFTIIGDKSFNWNKFMKEIDPK